MARRIAYVEDKDLVRKKYSRVIRHAGFEVDAYASAQEALSALRWGLPDLAVLDVTQTDDRYAGYQLCMEIRRMSAVIPIVFLTSRQSESEKISGLRVGADDYISKETSAQYLILRIEALLRRVDAIREDRERRAATPAAGSAGLELDEKNCTVRWRGRPVDLPLTQYLMLRELVSNAGHASSHRDLMKAASMHVEPNTIAANIKSIRRAFMKEDPAFHCIRTERGRGYRWVEG